MTLVAFPRRSRREVTRARLVMAASALVFIAIYSFWIWTMWKLWTIIVRYMAEMP